MMTPMTISMTMPIIRAMGGHAMSGERRRMGPVIQMILMVPKTKAPSSETPEDMYDRLFGGTL